MLALSQLAPSGSGCRLQVVKMKTASKGWLAIPEADSAFLHDPLSVRRIVVPLDFSSESLRALDFALPLAKRFGAQIHVVHVYEGAHEFSTVTTSPLLWSVEEAKRHLADEVELAFGTRPRRENCHLRTGKPGQEIVASAEELGAELIVIATHGRSGFRHVRLGSITEKVIRQAHCPVLVVREKMRGPIKTAAEGIVLQRILVPVDFSECAATGARYASAFGTAVGADLLVAQVIRPPLHLVEQGRGPAEAWPAELKDTVLAAGNNLDTLTNSLPLIGISAETQVDVGVPAEKLAQISSRPDIDLIVLSTHGFTGLRRALLDSVAEELTRTADCPVLVVPSHLRQT